MLSKLGKPNHWANALECKHNDTKAKAMRSGASPSPVTSSNQSTSPRWRTRDITSSLEKDVFASVHEWNNHRTGSSNHHTKTYTQTQTNTHTIEIARADKQQLPDNTHHAGMCVQPSVWHSHYLLVALVMTCLGSISVLLGRGHHIYTQASHRIGKLAVWVLAASLGGI